VIGTTLNGRFQLDKELGRGGMGAVYRARDTLLERSVAIKVLKDLSGEEVGRKIRLEAQILARLVHEHIVRLYDFSADGETYYFIMEEVEGSSFARRLRKIPLLERIRVVAETADALDYAHHQGVIHRDVKPANVLMTASDGAKLSDFGLSLLSDASQDSGIVRGTPHYMSPEQAKGRKIDHRTDLYALGVILYECATSVQPFTGPVMTVMAQHINAEVTPPRERNPELSPELEALILNLMAKEPGDRPSSGREVAARLRSLMETGRISGDAISSDRSAFSSASAASISLAAAGASGPASMGPQSMTGASAAGSLRSIVASAEASAAPAGPVLSATAREAQELIEIVTADPIELGPDERYLHGHYLGYLLGGSRRRGILLRRPLDPLNADRARLLLAMTALTLPDGDGIEVDRAAALLDARHDVRPMLTPIVLAKYLIARTSPSKRRRFRGLRQQLQQASEHAARHMSDDQGVLNPGLMPQVLDDLRRLAPVRTEVDDLLVERWNEVSEVWRSKPDFRNAVLRYATLSAWKDPASVALWPEVVYPLIERARRQRHLRSGAEAVWDAVCGSLLHIGDAGVKMDRAIRVAVPYQVMQQLDGSIDKMIDDPIIEVEPPPEPAPREPEAIGLQGYISAASFHDLEVDQPTRSFVRLMSPDPIQKTVEDLRALWKESTAALRSGGQSLSLGSIPVGIYRLVVIPSVRSRSAGQLAIQGMVNKQVEMLVPPFTSAVPASKVLVAVWMYTNNSLAITYCDNLNNPKYIVWDAAVSQQTNLDDLTTFSHHLYGIGLEAPENADRALTKILRPKNPV
jgi:eukaryotic-like serine/threonine-protein kinase